MVASIQDKVGSWYSNLETDVVGSTITGGGVGKYLKAWTASSINVTGSAGATDDLREKRKAIASTRTFKKSFIVLWFPNFNGN
jgi:peptidyl-prolyl cis-trans isomerase-like 2